jgi:DMSO/TMAO reductase YedYZ molybdopterin-dependent catalytic subunit
VSPERARFDRGRRALLARAAAGGGLWLLGCGDDSLAPLPAGGCTDPFAGAELLGLVPFVGEGDPVLDTAFGTGLDGRLYTDLSGLGPETLVTPNDHFYVRTRAPASLAPAEGWSVAVAGEVTTPRVLAIEELLAASRPQGVILMECSGNGPKAHFGLISAATWEGVPLLEIVEAAGPLPGATRVRVTGYDVHAEPSELSTAGASWVLSLDDLAATGAFLATRMNGVALPLDHGRPVRLLVPGWYGCTCIKWVESIELVTDDVPATSQMQEFASRTHQTGIPALARDYRPASMDQAAMPVRVERWRTADGERYRIVGVMWGGYRLTDALALQLGASPPERVAVCPPQSTNATWTLWSHVVRPPGPGVHAIRLAIDDPTIPTRRLDSGFYERSIEG